MMKDNEAYHLAQIVVVNADSLTTEEKLDVLKVLFTAEKNAFYLEELVNDDAKREEIHR